MLDRNAVVDQHPAPFFSRLQDAYHTLRFGANLTGGRARTRTISNKTQANPPNPPDAKPTDAEDLPRAPQVNQNLDAIPACWASVEILSTALANSRIGVARLVDPIKGRYEWVPNHRIAHLLRAPSKLFHPWQNWQLGFEALVRGGNGYYWIRRNAVGQPIELVPAAPSRAWWETVPGSGDDTVRVYDLYLAGWSQYGAGLVGTSRARYRVPSWDVISFHGLGFDGLESPSPIQYAAAATLETARAAMQHNLGHLTQGLAANVAIVGASGAMESMAGIVKEKEEAIELAKKIEKAFSGAVNAGRTPAIPWGFDLKELKGFSAVDLELVKVLGWTVDNVVMVFGVPKWLLSREATPKKLDQSGETFSRWSLQHRRRNIEDELTVKLLSPMERARGLFVKMDTTHYSLGSLTDLATVANQMVARTGIWTINEGRELTNQPPLPGGDVLLQPQGAPQQEKEDQDDANRNRQEEEEDDNG